MSTQPVEYRDVKGFSGYRVGDDGSVWCQKPINGKPGGVWKWRQLTPQPNGPLGHLFIYLHIDGKPHHRYVHRLVLEAFVGECPKGMQCRHFPDRNPRNNRLENLSWSTAKRNQADRVEHGTDFRGEKSPNAKLTKAKVRAIRAMCRRLGRGSQRRVAAKFGIAQPYVSKIVRYQRWAHVA